MGDVYRSVGGDVDERVGRVDENGTVFTVADIPAEAGGDVPGHIAVGVAETIFMIENTP